MVAHVNKQPARLLRVALQGDVYRGVLIRVSDCVAHDIFQGASQQGFVGLDGCRRAIDDAHLAIHCVRLKICVFSDFLQKDGDIKQF